VPELTIALKSAGFDILAAGVMSPEDAPDIEAGSVDCYVQVPVDGPAPGGWATASDGALGRARAVIAHELLARFDTAAAFLPLLAPGANVVLLADDDGGDPDPAHRPAPASPEQQARRALVDVLAEAISRECGRAGVRAAVIGANRAPDEIAALAARPPQPPWWYYADVDPELGFADWRNSVLCLASAQDA
jgi:hypothetical protein